LVGTLTRRVERLEASYGGGACPRCEGTMIVFGPGSSAMEEPAVYRRGVQFGPEESKRFWAQEQPHGQCPTCGSFRQHVRVSWGPRT